MSISAPATELPRSADAFVDSIGVNTHFEYKNGPYDLSKDQELKELIALGVRHIRDGLPNPRGEALQTLNDLCAHGIHHTASFAIDVVPASIVSTLTTYGPSCVDAVEPINEYDSIARNVQHPDPDWVAHLLQEQRVIYDTMKAHPEFANITVLGPALGNLAKMALLGNLEAISDAGNMHWGTCDGSPLTTHYKNIDRSLAYFSTNYPTKPIWTTEAAYSDNVGKSICDLPDSVVASYIVRTQVERWTRNQPKTYWYQFSDEYAENNFGRQGFVTNTGQPKPQFFALQSLISLLSDRGPAFTPTALEYSMTGETQNLHHLLLQKRDGTYYLLLWLEVESWDASNHKPRAFAVPDQNVTLKLPGTVASIKNFSYGPDWRFTQRTMPVASSEVTFKVADRMSVVSFKTR